MLVSPGVAARWTEAIEVLGGRPVGAEELEAAYTSGERSYHDLVHIAQVLRDSDLLADDLGLGDHQRAVLTLAVCAHDVVYDGRGGDDERASAQWAARTLVKAGVGQGPIAHVVRLIEQT